ncbi:MAG: hypothetical protein JXR95_11740 [Deltaproteobacteria bacterium]|nr:hypothetical protein [Deltaproteobacteria bacterium]
MKKSEVIQQAFCAKCGTDVVSETEYRNIPMMCPVCTSGLDDKAIESGMYGPKKDVIGCSWKNGKLYVVTYAGDLGPPHRPGVIDRWPEKVFSILSENLTVCFPATRWVFDVAFFPAIEKIINSLGKKMVLYQR